MSGVAFERKLRQSRYVKETSLYTGNSDVELAANQLVKKSMMGCTNKLV
jgi:hypothetical protein